MRIRFYCKYLNNVRELPETFPEDAQAELDMVTAGMEKMNQYDSSDDYIQYCNTTIQEKLNVQSAAGPWGGGGAVLGPVRHLAASQSVPSSQEPETAQLDSEGRHVIAIPVVPPPSSNRRSLFNIPDATGRKRIRSKQTMQSAPSVASSSHLNPQDDEDHFGHGLSMDYDWIIVSKAS